MKNLGAKILLLITIVVTLLVIHSTLERRTESSTPSTSPALLQKKSQAPSVQGFGTGTKSLTQPGIIRRPLEETAAENHHFPSIQERNTLLSSVFPA